jgi:chemotaxis protein MotB
MFDSGSSTVKPYMGELLREIGEVLSEVPNRLTLEGHTDSKPFSVGERGYSNWELSSDRANASRRELISGGLPYERVLRVQGLASSVPFDKQDASAPTNRRISIIVMNRDAEDRFRSGNVDAAPLAPGSSGDVEPPAPAATGVPAAAAVPASLGKQAISMALPLPTPGTVPAAAAAPATAPATVPQGTPAEIHQRIMAEPSKPVALAEQVVPATSRH